MKSFNSFNEDVYKNIPKKDHAAIKKREKQLFKKDITGEKNNYNEEILAATDDQELQKKKRIVKQKARLALQDLRLNRKQIQKQKKDGKLTD